ncbi:MAG: carboxylating nicotinate-nucleotide diphosphorylase [Candidatus Aminicenantes bacterium]
MDWNQIDLLITNALNEDMPRGDVTSESIIPPDSESEALIQAKQEGILAGIDIAGRVFELINPEVSFKKNLQDGEKFNSGQAVAALRGHSVSLLKGERTALNFIQRLSGIATATHKFVQAVEGTKTQILDTRKTTPGLRYIEKYAVRMGGGINHRLNLSEMVLIKDNHLKLVGSLSRAVKKARENLKEGIKIEVEVTNLAEVKEAVKIGVDMIMLDNMPKGKIKEVVEWVKGRVPLEVSGKVGLKRAKEIACLGVNFISVGSLTHSYKSIDMSMEFLC